MTLLLLLAGATDEEQEVYTPAPECDTVHILELETTVHILELETTVNIGCER